MSTIDQILSLIEKNGITKNKLLIDLGLNKNSFVNWNDRGNVPSGDILSKIADYFNVSVDYLLGRTVPGSALPVLGEDERQLIENCRLLNTEGQEKLLDASDDLVQSGKYKKRDKAVLDKNA